MAKTVIEINGPVTEAKIRRYRETEVRALIGGASPVRAVPDVA